MASRDSAQTVAELEARLAAAESRADALAAELESAKGREVATREVLRVVGQSGDLNVVLDALVMTAAQLVDVDQMVIQQAVGDQVAVLAASADPIRATVCEARATGALPSLLVPYSIRTTTGRALLERRTIVNKDLQAAWDEYSDVPSHLRQGVIRSVVVVPLLRNGQAIGVLRASRFEVHPFTEAEIALLESFAAQAAIAIENSRLFTELNDSNTGLREALEQQTATAGVLEAISRVPTELQRVLDTICEAAGRLCGGLSAGLARVEGSDLRNVAWWAPPSYDLPPLPKHVIPIARAGRRGRAVREKRLVYEPDLVALPEDADDLARAAGVRSHAVVPLLRGGEAFGALSVVSVTPHALTDQHLRLLETFADQAVIAMENARLFRELNESNISLKEALEQQTATAEVLQAISRAPTDLPAVLQTIANSAARLCECRDALLLRLDGDELVADTRVGTLWGEATWRTPIDAESLAATALRERRTVQVLDILSSDGDRFPISQARSRVADGGSSGTRLAVTLLRQAEAIGVLLLKRDEVRAFTDDQIRMLEIFADQAVIAIENARLFSELNESNASLTEALEQQTATGEVLQAISRATTDLRSVLNTVCVSAARLTGSLNATIFRLEGDRPVFAAAFRAGTLAEDPAGPVQHALDRSWPGGRAMLDRRTLHIPDLAAELDEYPEMRPVVAQLGFRALLGVPLLRQGEAIGLIAVERLEPEPFTPQQIALLETFADQAVIAIENSRLFSELRERLEEQTATAQVLASISHAPTDLQRVLDTVTESAARLCEGEGSSIYYGPTDEHVVLLSATGEGGRPTQAIGTSVSITGTHPLTLVYATREVFHAVDLREDERLGEAFRRNSIERGRVAMLGAPLVAAGEVKGMLTVRRAEPRPFSERQIALIKTFADQAVIAIENARLFSELHDRTAELSASVERLTALSEVSGAVSATLDLDRVLATVVQRAAALAGAEAGTIYVFDPEGGVFEPRANHGLSDELTEALRAARIRIGQTPVGQAAAARAPVQVPDLEAEQADTPARRALEKAGFRSLLAVPLLREQAIIGALVVRRRAPGEFDASTVELLQTFAAQSALAIQNARLFQELAVKSLQLEEASRHKSEFLANMSHELRTPLNAIIGFTEVLLERYFGEVNEKQEDYLKDVLSSGQHLLALINDILDLSKVEAGRMELEVTPFDLGDALEAGLVMLKERATKKGIELSLDVAEDVGRVEADERKIKQVLFNLLTNAVKFTPEGGRVTASARRSNGHVEIAVADTGVGIAGEDLEKVFEEFGQAQNQQGQTDGTGLGLALVKRFVELHGGTVSIASIVGRGSTFTVRLPTGQRATP